MLGQEGLPPPQKKHNGHWDFGRQKKSQKSSFALNDRSVAEENLKESWFSKGLEENSKKKENVFKPFCFVLKAFSHFSSEVKFDTMVL